MTSIGDSGALDASHSRRGARRRAGTPRACAATFPARASGNRRTDRVGSGAARLRRACDAHARRGHDRGDGDARDALAAPDPAHALVRLALHADVVGPNAERGGEASASSARDAMRSSASRRRSRRRPAGRASPSIGDPRDGGAQHLDGIPALVRGIAIGEHLADVARGRGAEDRVGDRVRRPRHRRNGPRGARRSEWERRRGSVVPAARSDASRSRCRREASRRGAGAAARNRIV